MNSEMKLPSLNNNRDQFVTQLFMWMAQWGQSHYDEKVTQLEHALQAAHLAQGQGADEHLVVAALLHDIGHLITDEHNGQDDFLANDAMHEQAGYLWSRQYFCASVAEPIKLHVSAKRWLCSEDRSYLLKLSDASQRSYVLQGGAMNKEELGAFERQPHSQDAVQLRKWDDDAKTPNLVVPGLEHYREAVITCLN